MALPIYTDDDNPYYFTPLGQLPPPGPLTPQPTPAPGAPWIPPGASFDTSNPSGVINAQNPNANPNQPFVQAGNTGGYLEGIGITRGQGESDTEASAARDYAAAIAAGVPPEWAADFLARNYHDENRLLEAYRSDNGNAPANSGAGSSGGGSSARSGYSGPFAPPQPQAGWMPTYTAPVFQPPAPLNIPTWNAPAPFAYDPFAPPTLEQARNEPGFAFAMEQGSKALENSAAAKGVLRTGGTMKELIGFGQKLGEQNYGNVYNRMQGTYGVNRNNAADIYTKNYNAARDTYGAGVDEITGEYNSLYKTAQDAFTNATTGARDEYAPRRAEAEANFKRDMDIWLEKMRIAGLIEQDSD
jgi:hypothetical protein